jgi:hypothetical protein
MIKVFGGGTRHAEPLHHGHGAPVRGNRERDDLREPEAPEPAVDRRARRFGRVAVPPVVEGETPAAFNAAKRGGSSGRQGLRRRRSVVRMIGP